PPARGTPSGSAGPPGYPRAPPFSRLRERRSPPQWTRGGAPLPSARRRRAGDSRPVSREHRLAREAAGVPRDGNQEDVQRLAECVAGEPVDLLGQEPRGEEEQRERRAGEPGRLAFHDPGRAGKPELDPPVAGVEPERRPHVRLERLDRHLV